MIFFNVNIVNFLFSVEIYCKLSKKTNKKKQKKKRLILYIVPFLLNFPFFRFSVSIRFLMPEVHSCIFFRYAEANAERTAQLNGGIL